MWTDGVIADGTVEVGGCSEVTDELGSKIVRSVVDPVLFSVRVDATFLLERSSVSSGQLSVELSAPLASRSLSQRRRLGISKAVDGVRINTGLFVARCGLLSSPRRLCFASIGSPTIGLFLVSTLLGTRLA